MFLIKTAKSLNQITAYKRQIRQDPTEVELKKKEEELKKKEEELIIKENEFTNKKTIRNRGNSRRVLMRNSRNKCKFFF